MIKLSPNNPFVRHFSHRTIRLGHRQKGTYYDKSVSNLRKIIKANQDDLANPKSPLNQFGIEDTGKYRWWEQRVKIHVPASQAYFDDFYQRTLPELEKLGWKPRKPLLNWFNQWIKV